MASKKAIIDVLPKKSRNPEAVKHCEKKTENRFYLPVLRLPNPEMDGEMPGL
jgi:hypothetical protein